MSHSPSPKKPAPLRLGLRLAAALILIGAIGYWAAKGANVGWNKDQVPVKQTDEITGLEFVTYEKRFVPGFEFMGLSAGLAAGLLAVSFLVQRQPSSSNS